jgi:hypothetical protein
MFYWCTSTKLVAEASQRMVVEIAVAVFSLNKIPTTRYQH